MYLISMLKFESTLISSFSLSGFISALDYSQRLDILPASLFLAILSFTISITIPYYYYFA